MLLSLQIKPNLKAIMDANGEEIGVIGVQFCGERKEVTFSHIFNRSYHITFLL